MTKRVISVLLVILTLFSTVAITASAASYTTGTYIVTPTNGVNVRSGAGTGYSVVGAASKGTSFYVSKTSGSWGYTSSIRCTNGTKSGWVSLDYCSKQGGSSSSSNRATYNDVFASVRGSGYSLSQARSCESTTFTKGTWVYVWGWLHDANSNLYKSYGSGTCNMTLSIYRPNGSLAHTYTYQNSDNNWIGQRLDEAGTWKIQSKITGSLTGTNTRTIRVTENTSVSPTRVSVSSSSLTMNVGNTKQLSATVYPTNSSNKTVYWSSSNAKVASVSSTGIVTAKAAGTATITATTTNGKTATCSVTVRGIEISGGVLFNYPTVGDIYYLSAKAYPSDTSSFTWSTSNSKVVSITSSGKMTAKAAGTATITVKTSDGRSNSITIKVSSANKTKTGNFDSGYTAKSYTTVTLNKNAGNAYIYIYTYDASGKKSSGEMHLTLRDTNGNWIWEGDVSSGSKLKLGNDHSAYRIYIAKKQYSASVIGSGDDFINVGKCKTWSIQCKTNCYI